MSESTTRVFLDTEFTDFTDPKLISFGLVAENGSEFYAELSDGWQSEHCSAFVHDAVLPRLNRSKPSTLRRSDACIKLIEWFLTLGKRVTLIYDADVDWQLLAALFRSESDRAIQIDAKLLSWPGSAMARHCELLLTSTQAVEPMRHHALVDARALRSAVLQTEADFRR